MGRIRVGVSGWSYDSWRGDFYPEDLSKKDQLRYAGERFDAIEVNGSFYSLLTPRSYRRYVEETPPPLRFAVKGSRFITHNKKLSDVETPMANFLASGLLALGGRLDVLLWQLPARHRIRPDRLRTFLERLPRDTEAAAALARGHDERVRDALVEGDGRHRIRHALEIRREDDFNGETVRILRDTGTALVVSHAADWPCVEELTAGFVYVRLHGGGRTYASRYGDADLDRWAARVRAWRDGGEPDDAARITDRVPPRRKGRDVYVFFDNDAEGHAPHDALRLRERVEGA